MIANNMHTLTQNALCSFCHGGYMMLYEANCRMDFKDFARRSTASNFYIFSTNLWVNVLNMSGICTAAPPHLDAHDKNSMYSYLYWSELGLNRRHAWIKWYFCNFTHNNPRWSHYTKLKLHVKITSIFFETPQNFTNHFFRGAHVLLRGAELPLAPP